jgi:hypothetical protein
MKAAMDRSREAAENLAIQALSYIGGDPAQLGRFLALTGIGPADLRRVAAEPGFLAGVLDFVAGDEALLVAFAAEAGVKPGDINRARAALGGGDWERDVP